MSKISFSKLNAKTNQQVNTVTYNDCEIEVKEYLPISEKMEIVTKIVANCMAVDANYYNPGMVEVWLVLELVKNYTNITFTEKQIATSDKLYDQVVSSGLAKVIIEKISDEELNALQELLDGALKNIYSYVNSIAGILQSTKENYSNTQLDVNKVKEELAGLDLKELTSIINNLG